ncbi:hypothetical protein HDK64DRAFT_11655 [Phyllosticta capitalensis]
MVILALLVPSSKSAALCSTQSIRPPPPLLCLLPVLSIFTPIIGQCPSIVTANLIIDAGTSKPNPRQYLSLLKPQHQDSWRKRCVNCKTAEEEKTQK